MRVDSIIRENYSMIMEDAVDPLEPVNIPADAEFNSNLADPRGRMLYVGLSKSF